MAVLRLIDSAVVALMIFPIIALYKGEWSDHYQILAVVSFFLSLLVFHSQGLYRPWRGQRFLGEIRIILRAWIITVFLILFLLFAFKVAQRYSRVVLTAWFLITPLALFLLHGGARKILRVIRRWGGNQKTAVIVGAGDLGLFLARYIEKIPWAGIRVCGFFDDYKSTKDLAQNGKKNRKILGTTSDLPDYLDGNNVDYVYIALPLRVEKKIHAILSTCRTLGAHIFMVPDLYAYGFFNTRLQSLGDVLILDFNPESDGMRVFDILFSLFVIAFTLPLTLVIALVIKLQDGGPVFYGHRRITIAGKEFFCLKFRTMHVDADKKLKQILENDPEARKEWEQTFKLKNDPRVTWVGRILRKTSLDELPQFINVLRGEMSVVGARPIVSRELADYYKENAGIYCSVKPGVTGIWQVSKRSDTENYDERVELDTWYALNRDFLLDLKIICKTVGCVFRGKGAY
jgi:exopolysaccharide biosynthesis polyprenyl glycosylphosphotransferase